MSSETRRFDFTLRFSLAGPYSVVVDEAGLRVVPKSGGVQSVSWHEVKELRERRILQRVDLVDASNMVRASLDYQIVEFDDLLAYILKRVAAPPDHVPPTRFPRRASVGDHIVDGLGLMLSLVGAVVGLGQGQRVALGVPAIFLSLLAVRHIELIQAVEISGSLLTLHRWSRRTTVDLRDVIAVRVVARSAGQGKSALDIALERPSGAALFIRPGADDIFSLYRATYSAWRSSNSHGAV